MCCVSDSVHTCMLLMMSCMYGQIIFSLCSYSTHVHVQYVTKKSVITFSSTTGTSRVLLTVLLSSALQVYTVHVTRTKKVHNCGAAVHTKLTSGFVD